VRCIHRREVRGAIRRFRLVRDSRRLYRAGESHQSRGEITVTVSEAIGFDADVKQLFREGDLEAGKPE
jgi:hypothetical protein